jgi:hypothetical protein
MKKLIRFFALAALVGTLALPALAQTTPSATPATPAAGGQDDTQAKADLYQKFRDNYKANPPVAYEAGKEYLQKYEATATTPEDTQIVGYVKKYVDSYEKIARRNELQQKLKDKSYNEAFALSKRVLTDSPDDVGLLYQLSAAGYAATASGNEANNGDAIAYTKKTIQLIQSGKSFDPAKPFSAQEKDEKLGTLNYALGIILRKSAPAEAMTYFVNAAQLEGPSKKDPYTYSNLAELYEANEYSNLATQFNNNCKTEEQAKTQACIDLKAKADQSVDHMIDALARAIAYSNSSSNPGQYAQARTTWQEGITNYYKYRNNGSDTGLKELIAGITSKPLPKPGEPIAPMTPAPSSTTAPSQPSGTSSTPSSNMSTTPTAKSGNATTTPASTAAQPNGKAPATAGKTSTTKTTPKRAHSTRKRG